MKKKRNIWQIVSVIIALIILLWGNGLLKDRRTKNGSDKTEQPSNSNGEKNSIPEDDLSIKESEKLNSIDKNTNLEDSSTVSNSKVNKEISTITILSNEQAKIYIDGEFVGLTNRDIKLEFGSHKIEVKKSGFVSYEDIIIIPDQSILTIQMDKQ